MIPNKQMETFKTAQKENIYPINDENIRISAP